MENKNGKERITGLFIYVFRISVLLSAFFMFFSEVNPAKVTGLINRNMSLFTSGISYSRLIEKCTQGFQRGWIQESSFILLFVASMMIIIGIVGAALGACLTVGNLKLKKIGSLIAIPAGLVQIAGLILIYVSYSQIAMTSKPTKIEPMINYGAFILFITLAVITLVSVIVLYIGLPKPAKGAKCQMATTYQLFLMFLPFLILCFLFSYLPLYGWRYAFFDYKAGGTLSANNFIGFKWFTQLFQNEATRSDVLRVLRNTLIMSGLGIATSWIPLVFAIFLNEIKNRHFKRFVQTFTTIPNFISWVLVYAIALAMFSTDGFVNGFLNTTGISSGANANYLLSDSYTWLKMLAWGMWKGVGWSAIIYIAGISGIDQQQYEAATVDGAGRFQRMWHVTVPGLLPTYSVMLLMAVAGILNNGMDQYLVFENARNTSTITVLDLYVYKLGIEGGAISLSTVIGMVKSVVSVILLFTANRISKAVRGESIV